MFRQCNMCSNMQDFDCLNEENKMYETSCINPSNNNEANINNCSCGFENNNIFPNTLLYASSYVPHQYINNVYQSKYGLKMGSIFPELVSPYCPGQSQEILNYLKQSKDYEGGCL